MDCVDPEANEVVLKSCNGHSPCANYLMQIKLMRFDHNKLFEDFYDKYSFLFYDNKKF